jgi:uncharacterized protein (DUF3084 family)
MEDTMDMQAAIKAERERINGELEKLAQHKAQVDEKIAALKQEIKALDAYETAKNPKQKAARGKRNTGIRTDIHELIKQSEKGMKRSDIIAHFNAKGDVAKERSITNALSNLTKKKQVTLTNGVYTV